MMTPSDFATALGASLARATTHAPYLQAAMDRFQITTPARRAAFLANLGHESGGLKYPQEIWGPTAQQKRYERVMVAPWPRSGEEAKQMEFAANRLAYGLGNTEPGDGYRYRGRGWLQITGRANYARARDNLRANGFPGAPDFEADPDAMAEPTWAAYAAGMYWLTNGLSHYADIDDFDGVCDLINRGRKTESEGDSNGYPDRLRLYQAALGVV